ncbi:DUF3987 domain-containing protein [Actinopolymorpha alba]|uniref:DUF3987 domain-containing protein n=1 Tax=Actinopolymorpha alba TaxID=533267 RepID=UPI00036B2AD4|nr:DUF3987 domain-containing protein [Actinopolymorpha alba]
MIVWTRAGLIRVLAETTLRDRFTDLEPDPNYAIADRCRRGYPQVPDDVADAYGIHLAALTRSLVGWTDPAVLTLTPGAAELVLALETETEPKLAPGAEWGHVRDWYGKWVGATARIAGLLHLAHHVDRGWTQPITETTWQAAETIGRYYAAHALAAFDHMGADPTTDNARTLLTWIEATHPTAFTVRDAYRANRTTFKTVPELEPALELLESHGHIRPAPPPDEKKRGRQPSPTYYTHPTHRSSL